MTSLLFMTSYTVKGTLHSKLALDFSAGLKVCIFGNFLQLKTIPIDAVIT